MSDLEWALLTVLRRHSWLYRDKGSKPDDPGWWKCSCGSMEGYWSDFQPHVAERLMAAVNAPPRKGHRLWCYAWIGEPCSCDEPPAYLNDDEEER